MSCHRWLLVLALVAILPAAATAAPAGPDITGQYRAMPTGVVITISACNGDRMCGRIVALGALPPTDVNNPVPDLQARPLCGATVLDGLKWQSGSWRGTLYEPATGTDYTISVAPAENGGVRVTGHSGRPLLSRTYERPFGVWERVGPPASPCDGAAATS
jgi:uncharacterized protein (DUF2147 family)